MKRRSIGVVAVGVVGGRRRVWAAPATIHADPVVARDAGVIVEWNEITERTLVENAQPIFQSLLYYGFTALAMYDAVVTIEGGYAPWSRAAPGARPRLTRGGGGDRRLRGVGATTSRARRRR